MKYPVTYLFVFVDARQFISSMISAECCSYGTQILCVSLSTASPSQQGHSASTCGHVPLPGIQHLPVGSCWCLSIIFFPSNSSSAVKAEKGRFYLQIILYIFKIWKIRVMFLRKFS